MWHLIPDGWKYWMIFVCFPLAWLLALTGCGPSKPTIETGIVQSFQSANASMLRQVDWNQIMAQLHGKVGPDTQLVAEGYTKMTAGVEVRFRGAELDYSIQGSGVGGGADFNERAWPDILAIQQRWELADDKAKSEARELIIEAAETLAAGQAAKKKPPSNTKPAMEPETDPERLP